MFIFMFCRCIKKKRKPKPIAKDSVDMTAFIE
jgi:hypothetical protein